MDKKPRVSLQTFIENHYKILLAKTALLKYINSLSEKYDYCLVIELKKDIIFVIH